jgi:hypothetical protein
VNDFRRLSGGVFVGVLITVIGVIFLLDQMGVVPAGFIFRVFWPVVLIWVGFHATFRSGRFPGSFWGPVLLLLGTLWLLDNIDVTHVAVGRLWPLWLIAVGVWLFLRASGHIDWPPRRPPPDSTIGPGSNPPVDSPGSAPQHPDEVSHGTTWGGANWTRHDRWNRSVNPTRQGWAEPCPPGASPGNPSAEPPPPSGSQTGNYGDGDDTFEHSVILGGYKRRISSQNFRYGRISTALGGFNLDFTYAGMAGNEAFVYVESIFGGGEIHIPPTWSVSIEAHAIGGGIVDETLRRPDQSSPSKRLIVRGTIVFGGVVVKN